MNEEHSRFRVRMPVDWTPKYQRLYGGITGLLISGVAYLYMSPADIMAAWMIVCVSIILSQMRPRKKV